MPPPVMLSTCDASTASSMQEVSVQPMTALLQEVAEDSRTLASPLPQSRLMCMPLVIWGPMCISTYSMEQVYAALLHATPDHYED